MLKFSVRRTVKGRPNSPAIIESKFGKHFVLNNRSKKIIMEEVISSLKSFESMNLDGNIVPEVTESTEARPRLDSVVHDGLKSTLDRQLSDPTYDRGNLAKQASLKAEEPRRNSACNGKPRMWLGNKNYSINFVIERNKLHPFLQRSRMPLRKKSHPELLQEDRSKEKGEEDEEDDEENEGNVEAQKQEIDPTRNLSTPVSDKKKSKEKVLPIMEKSSNLLDSASAKERRLGTVELPNLQVLQDSTLVVKKERIREVAKCASGAPRPVHRHSTGRISLRRELLRRRATIAQFNLQIQKHFEKKESRLQKLVRRIGKKLS